MADNPVTTALCFNPDDHPDATLKAFDDFVQMYELRYDAQYPDPPKVSIDAAIERWKLTQQNAEARPTIDQYDEIRDDWHSQKTGLQSSLDYSQRSASILIGLQQFLPKPIAKQQLGKYSKQK